MKVCSTCKYSVVIEDDPTMLECRRHAICPVGVDDEGFIVFSFPVCDPYMWCGDYERASQLRGPSNYAQEW